MQRWPIEASLGKVKKTVMTMKKKMSNSVENQTHRHLLRRHVHPLLVEVMMIVEDGATGGWGTALGEPL